MKVKFEESDYHQKLNIMAAKVCGIDVEKRTEHLWNKNIYWNAGVYCVRCNEKYEEGYMPSEFCLPDHPSYTKGENISELLEVIKTRGCTSSFIHYMDCDCFDLFIAMHKMLDFPKVVESCLKALYGDIF